MSAFKFVVGEKGLTVSALGFNSKSGKTDALFGVPTWAVDDASKMNMAVAADGMSASFTDTGAPGSVTVTVNGEGDPVAGVDPVNGQFTMAATAEEADSLQFAAVPNV